MGQPAAKQGDQIVATDTHIVMIPSPGGPVPTPLPHPFTGQIDGGLSSDVNIGTGQHGNQHAVAHSTGRSFPEAAQQQGDDPDGERHRVHQWQGGRAERRQGDDLQRSCRPAHRYGDRRRHCDDRRIAWR
jgi:hypothetical protein